MEKQELIDALQVHSKAIENKNAELQKAMEAKIAGSVDELKKELADMVKTRDVMQKQLDEQNIAIQKAGKKEADRKTFADELRAKLDAEIKQLMNLKGMAGTPEQLKMEVKTFLQTDNASVTTGSHLPAWQFEPGIEKAPDRRTFMLDILARGISNSLTVYWVQRKTRTDNSEWVDEGADPAAPSVLGYQTVTATMQNLSQYMKVSNNSLDDIDWLQGEIQTELVTLMMLKLDNDLLKGTVVANGFDGVLTAATAFNAGGDTLPAGVSPNKFDALVYAVTQILSENFVPNYIILHPRDIRDLKLTRDDAGNYLLPPQITQGIPMVDGLRIVGNTGMTPGTYLVGDFTRAKFWTRKNLELRIWEQNDDDAVKQLKTVTLYMRGTLVIKDADKKAFVTDTFADTIAEITAPGA